MEKDFTKEIQKFYNLLKKNEKYALVRFGDGEGPILAGPRHIIKRGRGGQYTWVYIPGKLEHEKFKLDLMKSLKYKDNNYYIGIHCKDQRKKVYDYLFDYLYQTACVPKEQLTFACIFYLSNWRFFIDKFMPLATSRECYFVGNQLAEDPKNLFNDIVYTTSKDAHLHCNETVEIILDKIEKEKIKDAIFLFATGPSSCVSIQKLWKENKDNFFIDIGSAIDPYIFQNTISKGFSRGSRMKKLFSGRKKPQPQKWG
jgi:hypothetical protein|tara:strand:+ start:3580 stop:4347 length:768 start_codon:yes stop_codon:yes gene_type:complete